MNDDRISGEPAFPEWNDDQIDALVVDFLRTAPLAKESGWPYTTIQAACAGLMEPARSAAMQRMLVVYFDWQVDARKPIPELDELEKAFPNHAAVCRDTREWYLSGRPVIATEPVSAPASRKGRFELQKELGKGKYGTVFQAYDTALERHVALKLLEDSGPVYDEARNMARIRHPGVVTVFDVGRFADGQAYIEMELVDGCSLDVFRRQTSTLVARADYQYQVARAIRATADALQAAHEGGVIHRDLSPSNVLIESEGTASTATQLADQWLAYERWAQGLKIIDFGFARQHGAEGSPQAQDPVGSSPLGTPVTMSPEHWDRTRGDVDERSDVYSLGALLFVLLAGPRKNDGKGRDRCPPQPPIEGTTIEEFSSNLLSPAPVPRVTRFNPAVPADLAAIVAKCLEKSPEARYQTAGDVEQDLQRFLNGQPVLARHVGPAERGWKWVRRNPVATAVILALVMLSLVASWQGYQAMTNAGLARTAQGEAEERAAEAVAANLETIKQARETQQAEQRTRVELIRNLEVDFDRAVESGELDEALEIAEQLTALNPRQPLHTLRFHWTERLLPRPEASHAHDSAVVSLSYAASGLLVATGDEQGRIDVWNPHEGTPLLTFETNTDASVAGLEFSADERRLLALLDDGTARLFEFADDIEQPPRTTKIDHADPISHVRFSPDGQRIAAATGRPALAPRIEYLNIVGPPQITYVPGPPIIEYINGPAGRIPFVKKGPLIPRVLAGTTQRIPTLKNERAKVLEWVLEKRAWSDPVSEFEGWVNELAYAPDGSYLAAATGTLSGSKGVLRVCPLSEDAEEQIENLTFEVEQEAATVAVHPSGEKLVVGIGNRGGKSGRVHLVAYHDGKLQDLVRLPHFGRVSHAQWDPTGERFLSMSEDGAVRVWNAQGEFLTSPRLDDAFTTAASFAAEGERLLTVGRDGSARLWSVRTGLPVSPKLRHGSIIFASGIAPAGDLVALASGQGKIHQWNLASSSPQQLQLDQLACYATFDTKTKNYAICTAKEVRFGLQVSGSEPVGEIRLDPTRAMIVDGDSETKWAVDLKEVSEPLAAGSDRLVPLWHDAANRAMSSLRPVGDDPESFRLTSVNFKGKEKEVLTWSKKEWKLMDRGVDSDGRHFVVLAGLNDPNKNTLRVWRRETDANAADAAAAPDWTKELAVECLAARYIARHTQLLTAHLISRNEQQAAVQGEQVHPLIRLRLWDLADDKLLHTWEVAAPPASADPSLGTGLTFLEITPDEKYVVAVLQHGRIDQPQTARCEVLAWSPVTGIQCHYSQHTGRIEHLACGAEGRVAVAKEGGRVILWNELGQEHRLLKHSSEVGRVQFLDRNRLLASAEDNGLVHLWDAGSGRRVAPPLPHNGQILALEVVDDRGLVACCDDRSINVWQAARGLAPGTMRDPMGPGTLNPMPAGLRGLDPVQAGGGMSRGGMPRGAMGPESARDSSGADEDVH